MQIYKDPSVEKFFKYSMKLPSASCKFKLNPFLLPWKIHLQYIGAIMSIESDVTFLSWSIKYKKILWTLFAFQMNVEFLQVSFSVIQDLNFPLFLFNFYLFFLYEISSSLCRRLKIKRHTPMVDHICLRRNIVKE